MRPTKKKNRIDKVIVNLLILGSVVALFSGPLGELFVLAAKAVTSLHHSVSENTSQQIENFSNSTELIQSLQQQVKDLKNDLNRAKYENNLLIAKINNTDSLNTLLGLTKTQFPQFIAAQVIMRSPSSWHQELIIDKGSNDKVALGMVVVSNKGIVGQVQEVKKSYSIVQLVASSQVRFGAFVKRSKTMGILFGEKPGYAHLKFIPIGSDIKKGDIIYTSEITPTTVERLYPYSYPVGKVVELTRDKNNSEMFVRIKLFEDTSQLSNVLVLANGGLKPSIQQVEMLTQAPLNGNTEDLPAQVLPINVPPAAKLKPITVSSAPSSTKTETVAVNKTSPTKPADSLSQQMELKPTTSTTPSNPSANLTPTNQGQ